MPVGLPLNAACCQQEGPGQGGLASLHKVVEALRSCGLVTHTLSEGETKFMGVCRLAPHSPHRQGYGVGRAHPTTV